MGSPGIRWKLTLWYGGVLLVVLTVFSAAVYLTLRHQMLRRIDQGLAEELADVLSEIGRGHDEQELGHWLNRRFAHHEGFDFQITRPGGGVFFKNPRLGTVTIPLPERPPLASPSYRDVSLDGRGRWRVVAFQAEGPGGPLVVQVARSLAAFDQECRELLLTFLLVGPLTLGIASGGGYFLARRALAPVHQITQTAREISAERLSRRIAAPSSGDELGALATTLNDMIERLERSFTEMQRFTADAAHELRTPLAVMRSEAEVALRAPRSPEEYRHVLENLLEEMGRLSALAEQLLFLSRQDAGLYPTAREEVAIDGLLREVVANMQLVAHEKGVELRLEENPPVRLISDRRQLLRVLYNLLDNAVKYTDPPGRVTAGTVAGKDSLTVRISDTGIGIPPEHLPHVFERFYCVDPARSGDGRGTGLGLAICQSVVRSLQGRLAITSTPGMGTTVCIILPCEPASRGPARP